MSRSGKKRSGRKFTANEMKSRKVQRLLKISAAWLRVLNDKGQL